MPLTNDEATFLKSIIAGIEREYKNAMSSSRYGFGFPPTMPTPMPTNFKNELEERIKNHKFEVTDAERKLWLLENFPILCEWAETKDLTLALIKTRGSDNE